MFPINFPATQTVSVDPDLWKECAGVAFNVSEAGDMVYYFPEGHAERCDATPAVAPVAWPVFPCRVLHVRFLADRSTDDVFAAIFLQPVGCDFREAPLRSVGFGGGLGRGDDREGARIVSYMKILTQSDANNGGGFSVPRHCAESIFPALNYQDDPPVQNLTIADVQGCDWVFRHIYRGTPKRHLLTTGWSKFVNNKKLVAGDTVIFMRDTLTGRLYVGIRRLDRGGNEHSVRPSFNLAAGEEVEEGVTLNDMMRVSAKFIEEGTLHAAQGKPFEIISYPKNGLADFVVSADEVDRALSFRWAVGMQVKMPVTSKDESSRSICRLGRVSLVMNSRENGRWRGSPWKMLQVTWVEPEHLQSVERVSPWQVEYAGHSAPLQTIHPPVVREPHNFQLLTTRNRGSSHCMMGQNDSQAGLLSLTLFNSNSQLVCMQGARHLSDVSDLMGDDTHQIRCDDMFQRSELSLFRSMITEVSPGGDRSGTLSPQSHSSLRSFGTEVGGLPLPQGVISSFQLFGKLIYVNNPVKSQSGDAGCLETDDSSKDDNEAEVMEIVSHT